MSLVCTRTQQPAGQGGFHTGELCIGQTRLRYIYDCGSTTQAHIDTAVKAYADSIGKGRDKPMVEVLFISHFDDDHIKGLETLFKHVRIKKAVIPYMDDFERLYLYAEASSDGEVSEGFRFCMSHPYKWLRDHEVEQVVVVGGNGDVGPQRPTTESPIPELTSEYRQTEFLDLKPNDVVQFDDPLCEDVNYVMHMHHDEQFNLTNGVCALADWYFLTYVHPWKDKRSAFVNLVQQSLISKVPYIVHALRKDCVVDVLKDPECVKIITDCYNQVWKGAKQKKNATTMSLYSGPYTQSTFLNIVKRGEKGMSCCNVDTKGLPVLGMQQRAGWLLTGDAPIKEKSRLMPFLYHYYDIQDFVGVLMLPHHGSNANFNPKILSYLNAPFYSIAAGMTKYHPHAAVQRAASAVGYSIVTTAEKASALTFDSTFIDGQVVCFEVKPEALNNLSPDGD